MADVERCPDCNGVIALIGRRHNCNPEPKPKIVAIRGRPRIEDRDKTLEALKPWLAASMSKRTWYRRQAEKKANAK